MKKLEHFIEALAKRTSQVAQIALVTTMILIMLNIVLRQVWRSIPGTSETVEILGAVVMAGGLAYCQLVKGHISIGILVERFSKIKQAIVDSFTHLLGLMFTSLLAQQVMVYAGRMWERNFTTGHLGIPLAPVIYLVGAGIAVLALVLLKDLIKTILSLKGCDSS